MKSWANLIMNEYTLCNLFMSIIIIISHDKLTLPFKNTFYPCQINFNTTTQRQSMKSRIAKR